ncbi:MAG: zinc-dependent metalloprotease [Odoribacter sp.]
MKFKILFVLVFLLGVSFLADAGGRNKKKDRETAKKEIPSLSSYQKLFKNKSCQSAKGMITLHKIDGKIYFEIPLSLLGKEMLLGSTVTQITDNRFAIVGEKPHEPLHIVFTKTDSIVSLRSVTCDYITSCDNIAERIRQSTVPAVLENFDIKAWTPDSLAVLIDLSGYLLSDNPALNPFGPNASIMAGGRSQIDKSFQKENSQILNIKAFADNISVQSSLTYSVSVKDQKSYSIYQRPFTAVMTRSLIFLPVQNMRPRIADPRMNIFYKKKSAFDNEGNGMRNVYYTQKWRIEPNDVGKYKTGELIEPQKPVIFYVDNAFPPLWKKYIKQGIEQWNVAFEQIGFKNVMVAKDFPMDDPEFDPDNLKYSCIRYSPSQVENAMGPSWVDPRSGEILNASVYLYHDMVKLVRNWRFVQTSPADEEVRTKVLPEEILGDCIRYVVSHEVGHCLGFMHNMAGSSGIPVDSLRSPSFTQKYGTTYSIMDYARNNYVAQPGDKERGVKLTPPSMGLFDFFAVKWLYTYFPDIDSCEKEVPVLSDWIKERSGDPVYRYGKQQISSRLDPSAVEEDLGDDAVKAATYGVKNLKYILNNLNEWVGDSDEDFTFRREIYNEVVFQYLRYLNHVILNIGGLYLNERYAGDLRYSYTTVPKEKQKMALQFLLNELENMEWLDGKQFQEGFPLIANVSQFIADDVCRGLMARPLFITLCVDKTIDEPYTEEEYMDDIYRFVWKKTLRGETLRDIDKKLQLRFLAQVLKGSTLQKGMSGGMLGINNEFPAIAIPEVIKSQSREIFGILSESVSGMFTNKESECNEGNDMFIQKKYLSPERAGFGFEVAAQAYAQPLEHIYFNMLKKIQQLLKMKVATGSEDTQMHYRLLIYKIEQALK